MDKDEPTSAQWKRFARLKTPTTKQVQVKARRLENMTVRHAHRFIISRWANLRDVRRHAIGWVVLVTLLVVVTALQLLWVKGPYTAVQPTEGGTYAEGVIGRLDTLNPIYASTQSERSASMLLFSSLLRYDDRNNLEGDLASGYTRSEDGTTYTVSLRKDAAWHDGTRVTADDVEFTLKLIKNPATRSYLYRTWQDIKVTKKDRYTIEFQLSSPFAPFPHVLTFGILPKHVLQTTSPTRMREHTFNRNPVGSGPFTFRSIQMINPSDDRAVLQVARNNNYYRGPVKLDRFQLHTYKNNAALRQGFLSSEVNAANDITSGDIAAIKQDVPTTVVTNTLINNGVYAFLKTDSPVLQDTAVRKALVRATDRVEIIKKLGKTAVSLEGPELKSYIGDSPEMRQAVHDAKAAGDELQAAGWVKQGDVRKKGDQTLTLMLVAPKKGDFPVVAETLAAQWKKVGVDVSTQLVDPDTLEQNVVKPRAYDVLINEIAIGGDPDVFAYWHSSQASVRGYNLSNYKSGVVDDALVGARARVENDLRYAKYVSMTKQWLADAPAVALYQPHLHYVMTDGTHSMEQSTSIVDGLNRYHQVATWSVLSEEQFKTP